MESTADCSENKFLNKFEFQPLPFVNYKCEFKSCFYSKNALSKADHGR